MAQASSPSPRRLLRVALFVALLVAALTSLLGRPALVEQVRSGARDPSWLWLPVAVFGVALALMLVDAAIKASREGALNGRTVVRVAAAGVFIALLVPSTLREFRTRAAAPQQALSPLSMVHDKDARVRALVMWACHAADLDDSDAASALLVGLDDDDPLVRHEALRAARVRLHQPTMTSAQAKTALAAQVASAP